MLSFSARQRWVILACPQCRQRCEFGAQCGVSASERARQSISKSIKSVLDRIAQSDARLGDFFARCIKTGTFCSYQPDPDFPIVWEFVATTVEQPEQPSSSGEPAPALPECPRGQPVVLEVSPFSLAD